MERISTIEALEIFGEDAVPVLEEKLESLEDKIELKEAVLEAREELYKLNYKLFVKEHRLSLRNADLLEPLYKSVKHKELYRREKELEELRQEHRRIKFAIDSVWRRTGGKEVLDVEHARQFPIQNLIKTEIKGSGNIKHCLCPFHEETQPSFCIYTDTNSFYCFSCKRGGDVIDLVMELKGLKFKDAVRFLS